MDSTSRALCLRRAGRWSPESEDSSKVGDLPRVCCLGSTRREGGASGAPLKGKLGWMGAQSVEGLEGLEGLEGRGRGFGCTFALRVHDLANAGHKTLHQPRSEAGGTLGGRVLGSRRRCLSQLSDWDGFPLEKMLEQSLE